MPLPTEHLEQATLVSWFEDAYPSLRIFAIPNGATLAGTIQQRSKQVNKLKAEGMRTGVPDLFIPAKNAIYAGLFIEMKRSKGGTLSNEQKDWLNFLNEQGYKASVCAGYSDAVSIILDYFENK